VDKEDLLWEELKKKAKEQGYGKIGTDWTIHQGRIVAVESVPERTKWVMRV
jgi:hypothetical protein